MSATKARLEYGCPGRALTRMARALSYERSTPEPLRDRPALSRPIASRTAVPASGTTMTRASSWPSGVEIGISSKNGSSDRSVPVNVPAPRRTSNASPGLDRVASTIHRATRRSPPSGFDRSDHVLWLAAVFYGLKTFLAAPSGIVWNSLVQKNVKDDPKNMGKVYSAISVLWPVGTAVGVYVFGKLLSGMTVESGMLLFGGLMTLDAVLHLIGAFTLFKKDGGDPSQGKPVAFNFGSSLAYA